MCVGNVPILMLFCRDSVFPIFSISNTAFAPYVAWILCASELARPIRRGEGKVAVGVFELQEHV